MSDNVPKDQNEEIPADDEGKPKGLFEYILTNYRGTFVTFFLLPISSTIYCLVNHPE